jgi:hypothetical protein
LEAHAIDVVVFNSQEADDDETTTGQKETIDLNTHLSGGIAEGREFEIVYTAGWVGMVNYELTGSMLDVMVPEPFDTTQNAANYAQDALILVEAKDTDGESAVLYVKVRGNIAPTGGGGTEIDLTVGTQAAPSGDGDAPDYHTADNVITCPTLNVCMVDLTGVFSDDNLQDSMRWMVDVDSDSISAVPTAKGVMITGRKAAATAIVVKVWPVDDGDLPENREDSADTMDVDESTSPLDDAVQMINVIVDGAPTMSRDAIENVTMDVGATGEIVGTAFDPEAATLTHTVTMTGDERVARVNLADTLTNGGQVLTVDSDNSGTATFTVRMLEPENESARGGQNGPRQYVEHTFTVTVSQTTG